jgi:hypothetical protein
MYQSDVIISKASFYGCLVARLFRKKSIIFPDSEVVVVTNKIVVPLASMVVTPETFELDFGEKHIKVSGFFENCYLSPSVFTPDNTMIDKYNLKTPYAIFRFIGWTANHDLGKNGFSLEEKIKAVELVNKNMAVYISSEVTLPEALEKYKLKTPASSIHQVLSFADLYFGDSQTMATESALLGTPSIRSNSFVGENDMSNFKILENKYKLLHNIADFESVYKKLEDYSQNSHKNEWLRRRDIYTRLVGDTNSIIVDLILSI